MTDKKTLAAGFKPLNDAGVPADGTFDFSAALDADPLMPKYSPPSVGNTHNKVHRKLQQAQQLAQNHLDNTGNDGWFYVSAEYVDTRSVEEQELSGADSLDDVDVVVYVLSRDLGNQTGAAIRLPPGRIDGAQLREMLDDAMVYVMRDVKRAPEPEPVTSDDEVGDWPLEDCCSLGTCYQDDEWPEDLDDENETAEEND